MRWVALEVGKERTVRSGPYARVPRTRKMLAAFRRPLPQPAETVDCQAHLRPPAGVTCTFAPFSGKETLVLTLLQETVNLARREIGVGFPRNRLAQLKVEALVRTESSRVDKTTSRCSTRTSTILAGAADGSFKRPTRHGLCRRAKEPAVRPSRP